MTRHALTALATAAAYAAGWWAVKRWRRIGSDGLTDRERRRHAREYARGPGAPATDGEVARLRRLAEQYGHTIGVDRPVEERREEALRLSQGAPRLDRAMWPRGEGAA